MIKKALLIATLVVASLAVQAKPVDPAALLKIAANLRGTSYTDDMKVQQIGQELTLIQWASGFALLAADDCVRPVLAYSRMASSAEGDMPANLSLWLEGYRREIASCIAAGVEPSARVRQEWQRYLQSPHPSVKSGTNFVPPLLTTTWNQRPYYNELCPYSEADSAHAVAGCTAIATAQIMKYWNHPAHGHGSHSYYSPMGHLSVNFDTTYLWDSMPDALTAVSSATEVAAVALLVYHVGVATDMAYGINASGASVVADRSPSALTALKNYFGYSPALHAVNKRLFADDEWDSLMRNEIDRGRPILYTGYDPAGGHAFVLDGYDTLGMFHVNWGWGGAYDGYYTIDSLSPGAGGVGGNATYTFNDNNAALIGIYPVYGGDSLSVVTVVPSDSTLGTVSGSGTYLAYSSTVDILAQAAAGSRFVGWKSGHETNPFTFRANGNYTDTAIFARVYGDTLGYAPRQMLTSWQDDYGDLTEWGIRLPASSRLPERSLVAVNLFASADGQYTMNIYQADNIDTASPIYTHQLYADSLYSWMSIVPDSAIVLDNRLPLWVTFNFTTTSQYPAAMANYSGNPDGIWYHLPSGWVPYDSHGINYSWLINAILSERDCIVSVSSADTALGTVDGSGSYPHGGVATLTATHNPQAEFVAWSNGATDNPYRLSVQGDTSLTAIFRDLTSSIDPLASNDINVSTDGLTIIVTTPTPLTVDIYAADGRLVGSSPASCHHRLSVPATGLYIVSPDGQAARRVIAINNN